MQKIHLCWHSHCRRWNKPPSNMGAYDLINGKHGSRCAFWPRKRRNCVDYISTWHGLWWKLLSWNISLKFSSPLLSVFVQIPYQLQYSMFHQRRPDGQMNSKISAIDFSSVGCKLPDVLRPFVHYLAGCSRWGNQDSIRQAMDPGKRLLRESKKLSNFILVEAETILPIFY